MAEWRKYHLFDGKFYFHRWYEHSRNGTTWVFRRKDNEGRLYTLRDQDIRKIFSEHSNVILIRTDSNSKFLEVGVPKGTSGKQLEAAFTAIAKRMPE